MTWGKTRVKQLRTNLGLSQAEFAQALGCRQQTVSEWELGAYEPANAYGRLLEMLETQYRHSAPQLVESAKPHSAPNKGAVAKGRSQVVTPRPNAEPSRARDFENFENGFDKAFDPGID